MRQIEILDTTLRDGEQTSGVSFSRTEKLAIVRLLIEDLNVPRIEIASARVSEGEFLTAKHICEWAKRTGNINKIESNNPLIKSSIKLRLSRFITVNCKK